MEWSKCKQSFHTQAGNTSHNCHSVLTVLLPLSKPSWGKLYLECSPLTEGIQHGLVIGTGSYVMSFKFCGKGFLPE